MVGQDLGAGTKQAMMQIATAITLANRRLRSSSKCSIKVISTS
jgi:hypothetical protein